MAQSKRYKKALESYDPKKRHTVDEAVTLVKGWATTKFDQSVEVVMKLGVDPKKSEQNLRGSLALPKGIGKTRKVIVFADGAEAVVAKELGADEVGMEELAKKIEGGWLDFDVAIAMPRTMKVIAKLGKVLGPQGKMPTPKAGTVTDDIRTAVREFKAGKIEFRTDAAGNVQAAIGKTSFSEGDLKANIEAFIEHIKGLKPTTIKGVYLERVAISASMSPGVTVAVSEE